MSHTADEKYLRECKLFRGFDESEFRAFRAASVVSRQSFEKDRELAAQGDRIDCIAVVLSGTLFGEKKHVNGRSPLIQIYNAPDTLFQEAFFSELGTCPIGIVAATRGEWLKIYGIRELLERHAGKGMDFLSMRDKLMRNLLAVMASESIRAGYRANVLAHYTLRDRVLAFLSNVTERRGCATVDIGMTHEEFSRYLCVARGNLTSELNRLRREGLIDYRGKRYTLSAPTE